MKKLNIRNKETHLLVLFGLLALLFISVNLANNYTHQDNFMSDDKFPTSSEISINIVSPTINEYFNATKPGFIVEIDDTENPIDTMWYTIDGGVTNITFTVNGTIDQTEWTAHAEGPVTLIFYSNNSISEEDSVSVAINKDSINPSIDSIDSPLPGAWFDSAPPSYSLSITEANLDSVWYTLDGGLNNYTGALSGTIDSTAWSNAGQGAVTIRFYANDSADNWDSASVGINRDTVNPSIDSIDSPSSGTWFNSTPPSYSLSINEVNLDSIWYTLDAGTNNYTGALSGTIDSTAWSNAGQGAVTILFYVNDSAANWDSASVGVNKDSLNPSIDSIDSPSPGAWFNSTPPTYSLSITEVNLDSIWYTLDGGTNNYTGATSGTIDSTAWNNAGQGAVTITFYVNDSAGNRAFDQVVVNKDTVVPQINIISPLSGQTFGAAAPNFIVEIDDDTLHTMWYDLNGSAIITFLINGTIDSGNWTALPNGPLTLIFYANDTFGLINSASVSFNKNADAPDINIVSPTLASYFGISAPDFIVEIIDTDLDTMWYSLNGGMNITFISNGTIDPGNWTALIDGTVSIKFYANDSVGNLASDIRLIYKDTAAPTVNIVSPTLNQLLGINSPNFYVEINDPILHTMWYNLNGGVNFTFISNGTFNPSAWGALLNGTATIYFYANDSVGNEAADSVFIMVDKYIPTITVNLPVDGTITGIQPIINIIVNDTNWDSTWYRVDSTVITLANNTDQQLLLLLWNALPEGPFTIELFANDTAGNLNNFNSMHLTKDISAPIIVITNPLPNVTVSSAPQITLTINDATLNTTWYTVDGGATNITFSATIGLNYITINQTTWNTLSNGIVTITFFANDSLGRISSDDITIIRNVPEAFDFIAFLFGPIGLTIMGVAIVIVVVVILLRRRKFHKTSDKEVRKIESLWD